MPRLSCWLPRLAFIPFLIGCAWAASTESPWAVRVWRSDDGLPNNFVTGLAQTPDGYLWVATYSTPARFDGVHFEETFPTGLIAHNQKISAIIPSREGGLWLGALHGAVLQLTPKTTQVIDRGLPDKAVSQMIEDRDGGLWLAFQGGTVCRIKAGQATVFNGESGLPPGERRDRYVCSIALDRQGQLWFAKNGRLGVFRHDRFETQLELPGLNSQITAASDGGIWICSGDQILKYHDGRPLETHGLFTSAHPTSEASALLEDHQGGLWIGTSESGLIHFDGTRFETIAISDQRVTCLIEDPKGGIWVGTGRGGLNRVAPRLIELGSVDSREPQRTLQSTCQAADGSWWATTQDGAVLRREHAEWHDLSTEKNWPGGKATCVAAGPDGTVWIGTKNSALYSWREGQFSICGKAEGVIGREIHALVVGRDGGVWIGEEMTDVVQRWRNGKLDTFDMPAGIRVIRAMAQDAVGDVWIGTSKGMLIRISHDTVIDETAHTTGEPLSIRALHASADGSVWIGYADEGLGRFRAGKFSHFTSDVGFPENNVSQIITDGRGWLWFAGDHGIFKVRQTELDGWSGTGPVDAHYIRYGQSEGLFSLEATCGDAPSTSLTSDGHLLIPMRTALAIVHLERFQEDAAPPPTLLKRVTVDDRTVASYGGAIPARGQIDLHSPAASLHLPPGHHRLEFEFTALSFTAPENVRFRCRLDGFDETWVDVGVRRSTSYSRLAAGDYRFRVQACNAEGVWNETGAVFAFAVDPFFWQTWWFRLGVVLGFTAAVALVVRSVSTRRVQAKLRRLEEQAALARERTRIARDLHDELGTRLTELGLMAELERDGSAAELVDHVRAIERDLDTIVWAVNPKNDTLEQLVGFICRFAGEFFERSSIRCRLDIPDDLPALALNPELRHHLYLVLREAVNNVVKHSGATLVKLALAVHGNTLQFWIEDDGRGFVVAEAEAGERSGLKNMRERIEESGGFFQVESAPGQGTRLQFAVPLNADLPLAPLDPARPRQTRLSPKN